MWRRTVLYKLRGCVEVHCYLSGPRDCRGSPGACDLPAHGERRGPQDQEESFWTPGWSVMRGLLGFSPPPVARASKWGSGWGPYSWASRTRWQQCKSLEQKRMSKIQQTLFSLFRVHRSRFLPCHCLFWSCWRVREGGGTVLAFCHHLSLSIGAPPPTTKTRTGGRSGGVAQNQ